MNELEKRLLAAVDPQRLAALTLDLAAIASPTGRSRAACDAYAQHLRGLGMDVAVFEDIPESPSVAAWLRGAGKGPTLQLAGHLDTVDIPHAPPYAADGMLYGRGTADMKGALAAMAEAARVIKQSGIALRGDLLLTAFGLHEAPDGHGEGLRALIAHGVKGDAAIVCEVGAEGMPIAGKGMGIFEISVRRKGNSMHELFAAAQTPNPIFCAARLVERLRALAAGLAAQPLPDVGPESVFVGMVHSGDFYNRVPTTAKITGTRRHGPGKTFADVQRELNSLIAKVQEEDETGDIAIELAFTPIRESFRLSADEPIVQVVRQAYADLSGRALPLIGISVVADAPILISEGHVPTVYHGPRSDRAHADVEYVALDELVRVTRMYILSALRFCTIA